VRYLSILGPIRTAEGDTFTPIVFSDSGAPQVLSPASSPDGALLVARRALGDTRDVLADDTVGALANRAGLRVGALPEPNALMLAATAVAMRNPEALKKLIDARLVHELL
jgi:hypothetical protein